MLRFRSITIAILIEVMSLSPAVLCGQGNDRHPEAGPEGTPASADSLTGKAALTAPDEGFFAWTLGADAVSSYIWRGTRQGRGPHLQPYAECSAGPVTGGVWGTFDFNGYREVDLYMAMDLPEGFVIGLQDYWMADQPFSDFTAESGSHAFEASLGYESEHVSLNVNYVFNEAGGAGSSGGDLYIESRFSFDYFTAFMGAGNGWHTGEGRFMVCNVGLETGWDVEVSDSFIIPVTAQMIYNPDSGRMFFTAGFSVSTGR